MIRHVIALALLLTPMTAGAKAAQGDWRIAISQLQAEDSRLQSLGWKLASANAPYCRSVQPAIGLLLGDVMNYAQPAPIRQALGLHGDISVGAVAAGSPADAAGLHAGDEVLAVAGQPMAQLHLALPRDFARLESLHTMIDAALSSKGSVDIEVVTSAGVPRRLNIAAQPVCTSRFELIDDGNHAGADGGRVRIGRALLSEQAADAEAAALVAHELAHNILFHRARLAAAGRSNRNIRMTEREADRLAVWLIANAGYYPEAAIRFMIAWGKRHDPPILGAPDHDGWHARVALMQAELAAIRAALAGGAKLPLDWRGRFPSP